MHNFLPYGRHSIDSEDIKAVEEVLKGGWLTTGPAVDAFEKRLCEVVGASHAVACSNGTTALHLAVLALGIKEGDIVIVPAITFLATANAARYVGADVIFADIDPATGLMTAATLEEAIQRTSNPSKLKAVLNVHYAGQCEDLEAIEKIAKKYGLYIIEDAAHAIGTNYIDKKNEKHPVGANDYSDITTFSFHPLKTIAMGEGGAVTTNNTEIANKLKILRTHGVIRNADMWADKEQGFDEHNNKNPWYYEMQELGFPYRVSDINCALGLSQLNSLEKFKAIRTELVQNYNRLFAEDDRFPSLKQHPFSDTAWHLYVLQMDFKKFGKTRAQVMQYLSEKKIGTQVHYVPLYRQPYYKNLYGDLILKGSEEYYGNCLSLPLFVGLTADNQAFIANTLRNL